MIPAEYFVAQGMLQIERGFLSPAECVALAEEMRQAPFTAAETFKDDNPDHHPWRQTRDVRLTREQQAPVAHRLLSRLPVLNQHYACAAHGIQLMQFLSYHPGDYFAAHQDWYEEGNYGIPRRLISFVIFINAPGPETYSGGALMLYKPQRRGGQVGLALQAEPGMLITFDPHLLHEVKPVTAGERLTVAGWFC
ncbi:MAG: prolyl hydroxylase family protein [Candidatus Sericytochromatia bacterium]